MFSRIKIGGVEPGSLLERPGLISAIVFLKNCNFRCPYCHNPELVFNDKAVPDYPAEELFKLLKQKKGWVDSVIFTGGEPSLYPDLPKLIKAVKELGVEPGIHTNGSNPEMLAALLKADLLNYIAMDVKNHQEKYFKTIGLEKLNRIEKSENFAKDEMWKKIAKSIELIKKAPKKIETIFRITVAPGLVEEADIVKIGQLIKGAPKASIQQFRPIKCLDKSFEKLKPYPKEVLEKMADELEKFVGQVEREFL